MNRCHLRVFVSTLMTRPSFQMLPLIVLLTSTCGLMLSCQKKKTPESAPAPESDEFALSPEELELWLQRANNSLRLNQPLSEVAGSENLGQMKITDAARKMADDVAFYDMLTDFSTYWFGTKSQNFWKTGERGLLLSSQVAGQIPVIHGTLALADGKDYFEGLFTQQKAVYYHEFDEPYLPGTKNQAPDQGTQPEQLSRDAIRLKLLGMMDLEVDKLLAHVDDESNEAFCAIFKDFQREDSIVMLAFAIGGPGRMFQDPFLTMVQPYFQWCNSTSGKKPEGARESLTQSKSKFREFYDELKAGESKFPTGHPLGLRHVTELVRTDGQFADADEAYSSNIFQSLPNSSTNRNRKRASWVLKRFFCDDLTPLNVEIPAGHASDEHGSNPSCYSCHYKLDPMAGYFREIGAGGESYAKQTRIRFDDGAEAERSEFEKPWLAAEGSARKWDIGYIRSTTNSKLNTYGENFDDLLTLLRTAPEVRECFVRRVFEYTVGEEQVADRLWLKSLADDMQEEAKTSPQSAIKNVFVRMVTSRAFLKTERSSGECYDLPPGVKREGRAPCRIAAIIERQCQSCHAGAAAQGGLDLASWQKQADGGYGFNHKRAGQNVSRLETFQSIRDRLTTEDSALRMPLMKTMPSQERQEIFQWLEKTIANL